MIELGLYIPDNDPGMVIFFNIGDNSVLTIKSIHKILFNAQISGVTWNQEMEDIKSIKDVLEHT